MSYGYNSEGSFGFAADPYAYFPPTDPYAAMTTGPYPMVGVGSHPSLTTTFLSPVTTMQVSSAPISPLVSGSFAPNTSAYAEYYSLEINAVQAQIDALQKQMQMTQLACADSSTPSSLPNPSPSSSPSLPSPSTSSSSSTSTEPLIEGSKTETVVIETRTPPPPTQKGDKCRGGFGAHRVGKVTPDSTPSSSSSSSSPSPASSASSAPPSNSATSTITKKEEVVPEEKKKKKVRRHVFVVKTFTSPVWCNLCSAFIWGITKQGYRCRVCHYPCHHKCLERANEGECDGLRIKQKLEPAVAITFDDDQNIIVQSEIKS